MKNPTTVERKSERELVVTRTFDAPARLVFEAWTKPDLFKRWWGSKSKGISLLSCEMDVRVGGGYRLVFGQGMEFFGRYLEVTPYSRLVWTNDEGGDSGPVTTVTFEEKGGKTLLVMHELYPSKEALDAAGTGAADGMGELFGQLDEFLIALGSSGGRVVSGPVEKDNSMPDLVALELKVHLPARDFEVSKQFYQDIGFTLCWSNGGLALLHYSPHGEYGKAFLLQDYYVKDLAENLQMHLLVKDVDAWWAHIQAKQIPQRYAVRAEPPADRAWKMRDFILFDPAGVSWRVAQDIK